MGRGRCFGLGTGGSGAGYFGVVAGGGGMPGAAPVLDVTSLAAGVRGAVVEGDWATRRDRVGDGAGDGAVEAVAFDPAGGASVRCGIGAPGARGWRSTRRRRGRRGSGRSSRSRARLMLGSFGVGGALQVALFRGRSKGTFHRGVPLRKRRAP